MLIELPLLNRWHQFRANSFLTCHLFLLCKLLWKWTELPRKRMEKASCCDWDCKITWKKKKRRKAFQLLELLIEFCSPLNDLARLIHLLSEWRVNNSMVIWNVDMLFKKKKNIRYLMIDNNRRNGCNCWLVRCQLHHHMQFEHRLKYEHETYVEQQGGLTTNASINANGVPIKCTQWPATHNTPTISSWMKIGCNANRQLGK